MYFTQDDYLKIQGWLQRNSVRDAEFQEASLPLRGDEIAAIIQDGKNKKLLLKELKGQSSIKLILDDEETFSLEGGHETIIHDSRKQPLINIFDEAVQDNSLSKLSDTIYVVFTRNGVTYRTFSSTKGEFIDDYNHIQLTCTSLYSKDNVFYVGVVYLYYTLGSSYISVDGFEESPINTENISLSLYRVVDSLPSKPDSDDINKIHLVKTSRTDENDRFDEYLWKGDTWELIGTLKNEIDLSSYYTKTESDKKYITQQKLDGELQPYDSRISKLETDINNKEDKGYGITDAAFDDDSYELQIDKTRDSNGVSTQTIVDLSPIKGDINAVNTKVNNINKRIDNNGNASFTTLKVANKEVLPIIIINGDASGSGALTEYDKLDNAIKANDILFIKVTINSNIHILPLRWVAGNQGSYHLYFELPKIGADGAVVGYTAYKREIKHIGSDGYGGWMDDSWLTRESICTVSMTQAEYDALTTKEDVLYVIKG